MAPTAGTSSTLVTAPTLEESSGGLFLIPLPLNDATSTAGLELESNTEQIDLGYQTRRFLGNRAAAKPMAVGLSDSQADEADFEEEIDDMFHSVDWLDGLSDGSLKGLTDGRLWENMRLHPVR